MDMMMSWLAMDLQSGALLFQGNTKDGVYEWPASNPASAPILAFSSIKTTSTNWHHRLGHPALPILQHILSNYQLEFSSPIPNEFSCNACLCNKSHKLPFSTSTLVSTKPLQVIFSDVWTSPVTSSTGFKYYVIFVDHFTKYLWFYPLTRKSEVLDVFQRYKSIVENYFNQRIVTLYSDNGGEYSALKAFLSNAGITHLTTPPHTPELNGYSERRHRHIVETGLTLLTHASLPFSFWPQAFSTAVYLINRMPTKTLQFSSPFELIFNTAPNYSKLKSFGCLCYPWLRPYSSHKLEPKSKPCVFMGYSLSQSAYLCFDPKTSKTYASRHVKFVESIFPYASLTSMSPGPNQPSGVSWFPPVLTVSLPITASPPSCTPEVHAPEVSRDAGPSTSSSLISQPPVSITQPFHVSPTHTVIHPMITRARNNITKPIQKLNLHATLTPSTPQEPTSIAQALKDPNWRVAMSAEYNALVSNGTWELVYPTTATNIVGCKWIFRIKRDSNGFVDRYKARLVAKGFHQRPGVDYIETFSPVIKPTTIRLVLSIAVANGWTLRQLDINNAFLQGRLSETVFMAQPPGFIDSDHPTHVCKLHKAIYGLKQAPRAWYHELRSFLLAAGFTNSHSDTSLFTQATGTNLLYLLVYVDDIILTGNNAGLVSQFVTRLAQRFSLKDLGNLSYFLGIEVVSHPKGILLSQRRYIQELLARTHMEQAKPVLTPLPTNSSSLTVSSGSPLSNPTEYRTIVGSLQYLSLTRPDVSFAVNKMSQFMHAPTDEHWQIVKRILRYLCGTLNTGLLVHSNSPISLHAFSDADWAGNKDDYSSTSANLVYLGNNLISWSSKKQKTVARSSTEAEYRAVASTAAELCWIRSLMSELYVDLITTPVIYCDNVGATQLSSNPVFHSRMKHVAIDYHFLREKVQNGKLRVSHVSSADQLADLLTKPLPRSQFQYLHDKIGLSTRGLS
ncbi:retrovirus-related pol polyprotein from transposon RE2 [Populus alba x Populus x berolinensis]|nr:retrovirus-related pol polyprotein from transposon RE2 [Populus alba x Populus x berolinensis]